MSKNQMMTNGYDAMANSFQVQICQAMKHVRIHRPQ